MSSQCRQVALLTYIFTGVCCQIQRGHTPEVLFERDTFESRFLMVKDACIVCSVYAAKGNRVPFQKLILRKFFFFFENFDMNGGFNTSQFIWKN